MNKFYGYLKFSICLLGILISGCALKNSMNKPIMPADPLVRPCGIASGLSEDAMGQLGIQTIHIAHTYRIIIPTDNIFDARSTDIKDSAYAGLTTLAHFLKSFMPVKMAVSGYTDALGSYYDDQKLSELQAQSLIAFLWTRGVFHQCLTPIGIGKNERYTVSTNRTVDGSVLNRRIEITFYRY